jgi:putative ABC transport system substrate-binding protein
VGDIESALSALASEPNGGVVVMPDAFTPVHRGLIITLTARYRLPAVYPFQFFATSGGLMLVGFARYSRDHVLRKNVTFMLLKAAGSILGTFLGGLLLGLVPTSILLPLLAACWSSRP